MVSGEMHSITWSWLKCWFVWSGEQEAIESPEKHLELFDLADWGLELLASAQHGKFRILSTRSTNNVLQPKLFRSTWQCWLRHMQILVTCWTHISSDTSIMNTTWIAQKNWLRSSRWISRFLKSWGRMGKKSFSRWMCYVRWYKRQGLIGMGIWHLPRCTNHNLSFFQWPAEVFLAL